MLPNTIAACIRLKRERLGLTQTALSLRMGLGERPGYISLVEGGRCRPTPERLRLFESALDFPPNTLVAPAASDPAKE